MKKVRTDMIGKNNPNWAGGISKMKSGHLVDSKRRYIHRTVWEEHFGKIPNGLIVHHINGNKEDNNIYNLALMTRKAHALIHDPMNWKNHTKNSEKICRF